MRSVLTPLLALALAAVASTAAAQDIADPGCAAIEAWASPLSTARGRIAGADATNRQSELLEQVFSDAATEPVFGVAYSRWQLPQFEQAAVITARCLTEVRSRGDEDGSIKLAIADSRIRDRLRRMQRMSRSNPTPANTATAKVRRPDCDSLETWAAVLMTDAERRNAVMEGLDTAAMREQREAQLLSANEIEPRFGYPISEWTYNDFMYASDPITRCSGQARAAGDIDASSQLRRAYGIIRRLGNELR